MTDRLLGVGYGTDFSAGASEAQHGMCCRVKVGRLEEHTSAAKDDGQR